MQQNKPAEGIKGPEQMNSEVPIDMPSCVKLVTPQDELEFKTFVNAIIQAANMNALKQIEELMNELGRKLGA